MATHEVEPLSLPTTIPTTETTEPVAETLGAKSTDLEDGNPTPENSAQESEKRVNEEVEPEVVEKVEEPAPAQKVEESQTVIEEPTPTQKVEEPQAVIEEPTPAQKVEEPQTVIEGPTPTQKVEEPQAVIEEPTPAQKVEEHQTVIEEPAPAQKVEEPQTVIEGPAPAQKVEEPQTVIEEPTPAQKVEEHQTVIEEPTSAQKVEEPQTVIEEPTPAQKVEEPKAEGGPEKNDVAELPNPATKTASSSTIDSALKIATEIVLEAEAASQADTTSAPDVTQSTEVVHSEGTTKTTTTLTAKLEGFSDTVAEISSILAHEVAIGAQHIVEAVESHPELIAEGALAVVVGTASLVQPELIAGEIAIIGKMATDAAKKSAIKIVGDEAQKIVQAVAKDVKDSEDGIKEDGKVAVAEGPATNGGVEVNTADVPLKKEPEETQDGPKADHVVSLEIAQQTPQIDLDGDGKNDVLEVPPVTLKITIGADGTVKAVTQSVIVDVPVEEAKESEAEQATQHEAVGLKELTIEEPAPTVTIKAPNTIPKSSAEEPTTIDKSNAEELSTIDKSSAEGLNTITEPSSTGESNVVDLNAKEISVLAHVQEGELPSTDTKEIAKEETAAEIAPEVTVVHAQGLEAREEETATEKDQKTLTTETKVFEEVKPVEETEAVEEAKPVEEAQASQEVQPISEQEVQASEQLQATEVLKPVEEIKPIEKFKPIEVEKVLSERHHEQNVSDNVEETLPEKQHDQTVSDNIQKALPEENIIAPTKIEESIVNQSVPEPLESPVSVEDKLEDKIPSEIVTGPSETKEAQTTLNVEEPLELIVQLSPFASESTSEQTEHEHLVNEESKPPAAIENADATILGGSAIPGAIEASTYIDSARTEEALVTQPTSIIPEALSNAVGEKTGQMDEEEQESSKDVVQSQGSAVIEAQQNTHEAKSIEPAAEKAEAQEEETIEPGGKETGQLPENLDLDVHETETSAAPINAEVDKDVGDEVRSQEAQIAEPEVASHEAKIVEPKVDSHEVQIVEPEVNNHEAQKAEPEVDSHEAQIAESEDNINVPDHTNTEEPGKEAPNKEQQTEDVEAKSESNEVQQIASAPAEVVEGLNVTASSLGETEEAVSPTEVLEAQSAEPERDVSLPELADASKDTAPTDLPTAQEDSEAPVAHETAAESSEPLVESASVPEPPRHPVAGELITENEPEHNTQGDELATVHKKDTEASEIALESEGVPVEAVPAEGALEIKTIESEPIKTTGPAITAPEEEYKNQDTELAPDSKDAETSKVALESENAPVEGALDTKTVESEPIETTVPAITALEEEHKDQGTELAPGDKKDVETAEVAAESEGVPVEAPVETSDVIIAEPAMTEPAMAEPAMTESQAGEPAEVDQVEDTPVMPSKEDPATTESQADTPAEVIPVESTPVTVSEETAEKSSKRRSIWGRIFWPFGGSSKKEKESDNASSNGSESVTPA